MNTNTKKNFVTVRDFVVFLIAIVLVLIFFRFIKADSDEGQYLFTFSSKKLAETLAEAEKKQQSLILEYISVLDPKGESTKIGLDLSVDAALTSRGISEVEETATLKSPGFKDKIIYHAREIFDQNDCKYLSDIYIHPNVDLPDPAVCSFWAPYPIGSSGGDPDKSHCHCYSPKPF